MREEYETTGNEENQTLKSYLLIYSNNFKRRTKR